MPSSHTDRRKSPFRLTRFVDGTFEPEIDEERSVHSFEMEIVALRVSIVQNLHHWPIRKEWWVGNCFLQSRPLFVWMLAMLRNTYDGTLCGGVVSPSAHLHQNVVFTVRFQEDSVRQFGFIRDKKIHGKNNNIMSLLACGSIHQGQKRFSGQSRGKQCYNLWIYSSGIVRAVNSAGKLIKEHCFPRDWSLRRSWPWRILPQASRDIM